MLRRKKTTHRKKHIRGLRFDQRLLITSAFCKKKYLLLTGSGVQSYVSSVLLQTCNSTLHIIEQLRIVMERKKRMMGDGDTAFYLRNLKSLDRQSAPCFMYVLHLLPQ